MPTISALIMDSQNPRRGSTSQMCLLKILSIINTVPPPIAAAAPPVSVSASKESSAEDETAGENKVSGFDLTVMDGFCIWSESKEFLGDTSGLSSSSTTALEGDGSATGDGGCFDVNHENGGDRVGNKEHGDRVSGNSDIQIEEAEKSFNLLIEAAKLIFGEFMDEDKSESEEQNVSRSSELKKDEVEADIEPNETKLRRGNSCLAAAQMGDDFVEPPSSPVVRSKRGRAWVLPGKYRDSVLEPLTRFSRTRSSILPSKRRRRT